MNLWVAGTWIYIIQVPDKQISELTSQKCSRTLPNIFATKNFAKKQLSSHPLGIKKSGKINYIMYVIYIYGVSLYMQYMQTTLKHMKKCIPISNFSMILTLQVQVHSMAITLHASLCSSCVCLYIALLSVFQRVY